MRLSLALCLLTSSSSLAFRPATRLQSTFTDTDVRTGKPTGLSFLPAETVERAQSGSPIEKIKLEKDGTSAFVDVYEYARKIREGEMTWEDVEKADLDTVRSRRLEMMVRPTDRPTDLSPTFSASNGSVCFIAASAHQVSS